MATPGKRRSGGGGQGDDEEEDDVEAWRRRYFELIEDMEKFLNAIDGLDAAIEAANIRVGFALLLNWFTVCGENGIALNRTHLIYQTLKNNASL